MVIIMRVIGLMVLNMVMVYKPVLMELYMRYCANSLIRVTVIIIIIRVNGEVVSTMGKVH